MKHSSESKSVQRLIQFGFCSPEDIKHARAEAERFASPEFSQRIRRTERLLGALGDPNRIKLLLLLSKREMCVCELESALALRQPTVSHHLGVLEQEGLVQRAKKGRWVFYRAVESPSLLMLDGLLR